MPDATRLADLCEQSARNIIDELADQVPELKWSDELREAASMTMTAGIRDVLGIVLRTFKVALIDALVEEGRP